MFEFVFLWTDILVLLLVMMITGFVLHIRSQPHLRDGWRRVFEYRLGAASFVILLFYVVIGLCDSIHMRLALEREAHYACDFPFVEYGIDLHVMAEIEKGLKVEKLTTTPYDTDPPKAEKKWINEKMSRLRPRRSDRIPVKLVGKGPAAYLL